MQYKLIGLDMDGTLLNSKHEVTQNTQSVLKECMEKGIKVVLASGRLWESMYAFTKHLGLVDEYVSLNGAIITSPKDQQKVFKSFIKDEEYHYLLHQLKDIKMPVYVFDMDRYYTQKNWDDKESMEEISGVKAELIEDFYSIQHPTKILLSFQNEEEIKALTERIKHPDYKLIRTGFNYIEIVRKCISKGEAIRWIAQKYGVHKEEILTIGDSENDIEMLSYAGLGIAMDNAAPNVKAVADTITDSCDNEGVAKAIKKYVLKK
ncbi:MAG: HAD family phosphatase [Epulopiscium sp.]|nr:HAD family phosphatase [Candidatus Epulonipiscium sp.]